jgi:hypothetical protein
MRAPRPTRLGAVCAATLTAAGLFLAGPSTAAGSSTLLPDGCAVALEELEAQIGDLDDVDLDALEGLLDRFERTAQDHARLLTAYEAALDDEDAASADLPRLQTVVTTGTVAVRTAEQELAQAEQDAAPATPAPGPGDGTGGGTDTGTGDGGGTGTPAPDPVFPGEDEPEYGAAATVADARAALDAARAALATAQEALVAGQARLQAATAAADSLADQLAAVEAELAVLHERLEALVDGGTLDVDRLVEVLLRIADTCRFDGGDGSDGGSGSSRDPVVERTDGSPRPATPVEAPAAYTG